MPSHLADDLDRQRRIYRRPWAPDASHESSHMVKVMSSTPNTVSEAINLLVAEGYTSDLGSRGSETQNDDDHSHDPANFIIERQFRFEGDSNPDDEAIVLGVFCECCEARGVVVSAYGPDADPALFARMRHRD